MKEIKIKDMDNADQVIENAVKDALLELFNWMDEINRTNPMQLETDNEDIVEMFLEAILSAGGSDE